MSPYRILCNVLSYCVLGTEEWFSIAVMTVEFELYSGSLSDIKS